MKRALDIIAASLGMVLLSPLLLLVLVTIALTLGRPAVFSQMRPGLHGKPFRMYKFRSMTNERDESGNLLPDSLRLTRLGQFLRSSSLDELPELWNVVKGDMSLVGPRPLLLEYLPLYSPEQSLRHKVRPGITGWAQVNGRNAITWEQKFQLDVWYVRNWSFMLDCRVLWLTVRRVIGRDGINHGGEATMPRFTGSTRKEEG